MSYFGTMHSPTEHLLNLWEARQRESDGGQAMAELTDTLRIMGRADAAGLLESEMAHWIWTHRLVSAFIFDISSPRSSVFYCVSKTIASILLYSRTDFMWLSTHIGYVFIKPSINSHRCLLYCASLFWLRFTVMMMTWRQCFVDMLHWMFRDMAMKYILAAYWLKRMRQAFIGCEP